MDKELAVGNGFMRVSAVRPGWSWLDALMHPSEAPFSPGSAVRPSRSILRRELPTGAGDSWTTCWFTWSMTGAGWLGYWTGLPAWMIYWFVVSLVVGLGLSRVFKVNF